MISKEQVLEGKGLHALAMQFHFVRSDQMTDR